MLVGTILEKHSFKGILAEPFSMKQPEQWWEEALGEVTRHLTPERVISETWYGQESLPAGHPLWIYSPQ